MSSVSFPALSATFYPITPSLTAPKGTPPTPQTGYISTFFLIQDPQQKAGEDPKLIYDEALNLYWGRGVELDRDRAMKRFQEAAEKGYGRAQIQLGNIFVNDKRYKDALRWFQMASDQNLPEGHHGLASLYCNGLGVDKDLGRGTDFLKRAAAQGLPESQYTLALAYIGGNGVEVSVPTALEWMQKAANQNFPQAIRNYALAHYKGVTGKKDLLKTLEILLTGVKTLDQPCSVLFRNIMLEGFDSHVSGIVEWVRRGAEKGDAYLQVILSNLYAEGAGVSQDLEQSLAWLKKSFAQENPLAIHEMGVLQMEGTRMPKNTKTGFELLQRAAHMNVPEAQFGLAMAFIRGDGTPINKVKATAWLLVALSRGLEEADEPLSQILKEITPEENAASEKLAIQIQGETNPLIR